MATTQTPAAPTTQTPPAGIAAKRTLRRKLRKVHREKLAAKLQSDVEFRKTYFEARSKRSTEKKSAFRKKKSKKK